MNILIIIIVLVCVGIVVFVINKMPFIDAQWKKVIYWVIFAVVILWLLDVFGILDYLKHIKI